MRKTKAVKKTLPATEELSDEYLVETAQRCIDGMEAVQKSARVDLEKDFYGPKQKDIFKRLIRRPAIARVKVMSDRTENVFELIVCPYTPPTGEHDGASWVDASRPITCHDLTGRKFASDISVLGRLCTAQPGDVENDLIVLEIQKLDPCGSRSDSGIDSKNTEFRSENAPTYTIRSLRAFLKSKEPSVSTDWLDEEDPVDEADAKPIKGIARRERITYGLQRIVMNKEQEAIFAAVIDSRLIVLGAPGTGKTTTLVQRLRLKQYKDALDDEELAHIERASNLGMNQNWLIFTPSELLGLYVKNALDDQGLGHLNNQMTTWEDHSYLLGFQSLNLLSYVNQKGGFMLSKDAQRQLSPEASSNPIAFYESFAKFRVERGRQRVITELQPLEQSANSDVAAMVKSLLETAKNRSLMRLLANLGNACIKLNDYKQEIEKNIDESIASFATQCAGNVPELKAKWADLLNREGNESANIQNQEEESDKEDDIDEIEKVDKTKPGKALKATIRDYCRHMAKGRPIQNKRLLRRLKVLDGGLPDKEKAESFGRLLLERTALRNIPGLFASYLRDVRGAYRAFRADDLRQETPRWFKKQKFNQREICQAELDVMILSYFRTVKEFAADRSPLNRCYGQDLREIINEHCKMMIFVDEATDFSPVQLAAMNALTYPELRSFYASGDINQRLKSNGIRNEDELLWAVPDAEIKRLSKAFRQTRTLHQLGQDLLDLNSARSQEDSSVDAELSDIDDIRPKLLEDAGTMEGQADWIAHSIAEILGFYQGELPTIAVFVPRGEDVAAFAERLQNSQELRDNNLRVDSCPDGKSISAAFKIGVFPIEFIKGLEFEAVFFAGVDDLAKDAPDLFNQYLYVGATRASRFLGLTCKKTLPTEMQPLRDRFCSSWSPS